MLFPSLSKFRLPLAVITVTASFLANGTPVVSHTPSNKPATHAHSPKPEASIDIDELTSSLKVNGRLLGPQKIIISGKKTHIGIFRESASRQYQVTYQIIPKPDTVEVSASVSTTLFKANFQLMSGQQASVRQTADLPEIEVIVSAKKLAVKPVNQTLPVRPKPAS